MGKLACQMNAMSALGYAASCEQGRDVLGAKFWRKRAATWFRRAADCGVKLEGMT